MTTNERIQPLATIMADILEGDLPNVDVLDLLAALKPLISGSDFEDLALSFDMCPIHNQDLDSCADDDTLGPVQVFDNSIPLEACRHLRPRN